MRMKDRIVPIPQKYTALPGDALILGTPGKANFRIVNETCTDCCAVSASADKLLRDTLGGLLGVCPCTADGEIVITLKLADAPAGVQNPSQGYSLLITDRAVTVTGFGAAGLYYGVVTLTQCMAVENGVLALEPCNTFGINRDEAAKEGKLAVLPAYASVENHLELGVLDGLTEIRSFLRQL